MKRFLLTVLIPGFVLAALIVTPAMAQDKAKAAKGKAVQKVLHEDDRIRVTETTLKPGDVGPNVVRGLRVSRVMKGGTLLRTWADGKTETRELKTGEVRVSGPDKQAYFHKNIGKEDFVFYTVNIKEPKK